MRINAIYSPIGGVGKSVFSIALAYEFSGKERRTLLVDCATFGSLRFLLRQDKENHGMPFLHTLFTHNYDQKEDAKLKAELFDNGIISIQTSNKLMLLPSAPPVKMESLTYEQMKGLMRCLKVSGFDEVVIDMSSDLHLRNIALMEAADRIFVIQNQNLQEVGQMEAMIDMLKDLSIDTNKLVHILNRVNYRVAYNKDEIENHLNCRFRALIPDFKHTLVSELNIWDQQYLAKHKDVMLRLRKHIRGLV